MQEVTFIIGLPGSGKSTLIQHYQSHPFIDYKVYDDWGECILDNKGIVSMNSECRYDELLSELSQNLSCLISCIKFCDTKYLKDFTNHLTQKFPNIKINRVYFENDPIKSEANIRYRDKQNGGKWEKNEKGEMWYYGTIFKLKPLYQLEIKNTLELTHNYTIPEGSTIFPIVVQE